MLCELDAILRFSKLNSDCMIIKHCERVFVIVLIGVFVLTVSAKTQNLVANPGFEEYDVCPGDFSQAAHEFRVKHWRSANLGTPDNFNACSIGEADVPHNWAGVSDPFEGKGYVGIYLWMNKDNNYREYLQCKLTEPLMKDSLYEIEFHYKLSSYSKYSIDRIGLLLSEKAVEAKHDQVISIQPTISIIQDSALTKETGYWEIAHKEYRARGGEEYVTIGNFFDNQTTRHYFIQFSPMQQSMLAKSAYYYIDDVKIIPMFNKLQNFLEEEIMEFSHDRVSLDKTYILKSIQFEFDQYILRSTSFTELDEVVNWLTKNPLIRLILSGHTDDQGTVVYNQTLSKNRAKSVASYLIDHGINPTRIETFGFGKSKPLVQGATEEARETNRRVEIKFLE